MGLVWVAVATFALLIGCGGSPDDARPPVEGGPTADGRVGTHAEEVVSLAQRIDEGLPFGTAEARTVEVPGEPSRTVRLWREDGGAPVRLMSTEPDHRGRMIEHASFYFDDSGLFFVRDPAARYIFEAGRLTVLLDDQLNRMEASPQQLAQYEAQLRERVELYMAPFDEAD